MLTMPNQVIENIRLKCMEIEKLKQFIYSKAGVASDPTWDKYDPGYVKMSAVLKGASTDLISLVEELDALIPTP